VPGHLTLTTAPAAEPVSLAEAKLHLRVDTDVTADDDLITSLATAARQWVEEICGRSLITQTWQLALPGFPGATGVLGVPVYGVDPLSLPGTPVSGSVAFRYALRLPRGVVQSITSVKYRDTTGTLVTLDPSTYVLSADAWEATLTPAPGGIWPTTLVHPEGVVITYVAGYGDAGTDVPQGIIAAIKLLVGTWYENREAVTLVRFTADEVPFTVTALLAPYRILEFV
jgi:hypothetical protein